MQTKVVQLYSFKIDPTYASLAFQEAKLSIGYKRSLHISPQCWIEYIFFENKKTVAVYKTLGNNSFVQCIRPTTDEDLSPLAHQWNIYTIGSTQIQHCPELKECYITRPYKDSILEDYWSMDKEISTIVFPFVST